MSDSQPVIELKDVTHHYGVRPILKHFHWSLSAGECAAVLGPNGMGKSTVLSLVGGLMSPTAGAVLINGQARRSTPEVELAIRRQVVYLPDSPWLPPISLRQFLVNLGEIYEIEVHDLFERIDRLIDLFELTEVADESIPSYSTGQQKKAGLCAALLPQAPILVLDEPFSGGLDPAGLTAVKGVLKGLAERGTTILFASPVPELVAEVASRILILEHGKVLVDGTLDDLRRQAGSTGSLGEILAQLTHPATQQKLDQFFARSSQ